MNKLSVFVTIMIISSQIQSAIYTINTGTYLTSTPTSSVACKSVPTQYLSLSSSYFGTIGKTSTYYTKKQFGALDSSGYVIDNTGNFVSASTIQANAVTNVQLGNLFAFGASTTQFTMVYSSPTFTTPVVMMDSRSLTAYYSVDLYDMVYDMNITKNNFTISSASTASNTLGAPTCLTINFTNPCAYIVPTTVFKILLPTTGGVYPLSAFNASSTTGCNVTFNGAQPSGRTCAVSGDELTVTGMVTTYNNTSSLSIIICDILKSATVAGASKLRFENSNFTGTAALYAEASFSY